MRFKNHKKLISSVLVITIVYIFLRNFGVVPRFLEFKNWWWYNNLISYAPAYILGAYIGLYYPNIILNKEYCEKKYTYIGIFLVFISLVLCYFTSQWKINLVIIYTFIELVGLWFIFKPKIFSKNIPEFFRCNFYIFALHNPILIPITQFFIRLFFQNVTFCGIGVIVVKIIQIIIIVLICAIIRFIIRKLSPFIDKCLTGGR